MKHKVKNASLIYIKQTVTIDNNVSKISRINDVETFDFA